jgi:hypothetical protein
MINWKGYGKKRLWHNLRLYHGIFLERLRKITADFSQNIRSPGRDLNPGHPEYKARVLTSQRRRSISLRDDKLCMKKEMTPICFSASTLIVINIV